MLTESIIQNAKEEIAGNKGYPDGVLGSKWDFAMSVTHRTKKQIALYEELAKFLAKSILDLQLNKVSQNDGK